ncbi:MAG TPA: hypothetical protein VIT44_03175 [Cyclobacteriaceae bacterium]
MKLRALTNFLILIYGLSITAFGIMEIGHETMHAFKNGIHHHEADHHHIFEDHGIVHDDNADSIDNILSSLSFTILFYEFCDIVLLDVLAKLQYYSLEPAKTITVVRCPFIPPPIAI